MNENEFEIEALRMALTRLLEAPSHESGDFVCNCEWEQARKAAWALLEQK